MNITLHQLKSFMFVAECGSFARAAEKMYITPAALIQQLNNLENALQFKLFYRSNKGLVLTQQGCYFLEKIQYLEKELNQSIADARNIGLSENSMRIAVNPKQNAIYGCHELLNSFLEENKDIEVQYVINNNADILQGIKDDRFDLGALCIERSAIQSERFLLAYETRIVAVMLPDHPLAKLEAISPLDLTGIKLTIGAKERVPALEKWCSENPDCILQDMPPHFDIAYQHCLMGGITFLPLTPEHTLKTMIYKELNERIIVNCGFYYRKTPSTERFLKYAERVL